jgi:hypothetical protein
MGNLESVSPEKTNSREAKFGDTGELSIVLVSDAKTFKTDDSRKLRGNVSEKHVLKLLEEEKNKSDLYNKAWNNAVKFLKRKELITSTSDYNSWYVTLRSCK